MSIWLLIVLIVLGVAAAIIVLVYLFRYQMNLNRALNMVFLEIKVPKKESKEDREVEGEKYSASKDFKEVIGIMTHFYEALNSLYSERWYKIFRSQEFFSFELATID